MNPMADAMERVITRHGTHREVLVPLLMELDQTLGFLPPEALDAVSDHLRLAPSEVRGVASFYGMLSLVPRGQHVVQFCENAPCHLSGGRAVWQALHAALGIEAGQTSADGMWTLERISCIGACDRGPTLLIDGVLHPNVTPEQIPALLERALAEATS